MNGELGGTKERERGGGSLCLVDREDRGGELMR